MTVADLTPSTRWRIAHQWWFVLFAPIGATAWAAFVYLGLRLRRRRWLVAGVIYLGLTVTGWVLVDVGSTGGTAAGVGTAMVIVTWVLSFIHGLAIRNDVLERFEFEERVRDARHQLHLRNEAREFVAHEPGVAADAGIGRDPARFGGLVDVNHAGPQEFVSLPGFTPDIAKHVVDIRARMGGFDSVLDFVNAVNMPPRIFDRIGDRLICLPR